MFRIYLVEVYVSKLTLTKDAYRDTGGAPLLVKINFINLPTIEVKEYRRVIKDSIYAYDFNAGQIRHISKKPRDIVEEIKKIPLAVGVFRLGDNFPICYVRSYLAGCDCELDARKEESIKPLEFRDTYNLVDPGSNYAGQIDIDINVTNMDRSIVSDFMLSPKYFTFKTPLEDVEYGCCFRDSIPERLRRFFERDKYSDDLRRDFMKKVSTVAPIAESLISSPLSTQLTFLPRLTPVDAIVSGGAKASTARSKASIKGKLSIRASGSKATRASKL